MELCLFSMKIIRSKKMNDTISWLTVLCYLSLKEQEYIGNPIDMFGVQGITDHFVKYAIKKSEHNYPFRLTENRVPASLLLELYAPDFLTDCGDVNKGMLLLKNIVKDCVYLSTDKLEKDPYIANISFPSVNVGDFNFTQGILTKYDLFVLDNKYADDPFGCIQIPVVACMDRDYCYPILKEKEHVWMSIAPNEISTMQNEISLAAGNVLTFGLGLGYFPYIVSRKVNVSHVTVVEKSDTIADLFEEYLLPQMETKEKITIIRQDAFDYLHDIQDGVFDTCFSDIWVSSDDVDTYLKLKFGCGKLTETKTSFWIEHRFLSLLSLIFIQMVLFEYIGSSIIDLNFIEKTYPYAFHVIQNLTDEVIFSEGSEIMNFISPGNIERLLQKKATENFCII